MAFTIAVVQMTSTRDVKSNVAKARELVSSAADKGATIIGLPENWSYIRDNDDPVPEAHSLGEGPLAVMRDLCRTRKITLVAGTVAEPGPDGKIYNTSAVIDPDGNIIASYRKIHLFDIFIKDGANHQESKVVAPGGEVVIAHAPECAIGLTVCYDLRFPELFRHLAIGRSRIIFVPSAFTMHTGKDHWIPLLRARAIENLVYIAAPAQFGRHSESRQSYGKSLIVDPWGMQLATAPDRECVITAEIDLDAQDELRRGLPCLDHINPWLFGQFGDAVEE